MVTIALILIAAPLILVFYAYAGYPILLKVIAAMRRPGAPRRELTAWPMISLAVPVYNEERQIEDLLESLLRIDYPPELRQILVISDASSDGTDDIVRSYEDRGVEFLRLPERCGKTAAENASTPFLRGDIIINTDASVRVEPSAVKRLIVEFADPTVGVASGRDVSVARSGQEQNIGEAGYVGYEMAIRRIETRVAGIVGASGCFYAIRAELHRVHLPDWLSRDFASAMIARQHGYRSVSVDDAICYVPRTTSLEREYRRKVRTMSRGMGTIRYLSQLLDPFRYGWFAWMLFSHKICRWAVPWAGVLFILGLSLLAAYRSWAAWLLAAVVGGVAVSGLAWMAGRNRTLPRALSIPAFALAGNVAALHAALDAVSGARKATWEPTRRE